MWYTVSVGKKPKSSTGMGAPPDALERQGKKIPAIFYRTEAGGEPVREWLKGLSSEGPEAYWGGYQNSGVWLADRDARLQTAR